MKLLLDCSLLSIGGGIQVGLSVIENMANDPDFETVLVCSPQIDTQLSDTTRNKLYACHVVPNLPFYKKSKQGKYLSKLERKHKPDQVFVVFGPSYWRPKVNNLQGFALGKMLYPEVRKNYPSKIQRLKEEVFDLIKQKFFFRNVGNFVVETEVVKSRIVSRLGVDSDKIFVISNSYSPAFEQRLLERQNYIQPSNDKIVVFIPSSFYYHKNLLILPQVLKVLKSISDQKIFFKFTIPEESNGWKLLKKSAQDLGVSEHFFTVGHVPNSVICDEYLSSQIVLCPSLIESSTAVFPESFIAKRPLIVSDRDFARDLCGDAAVYFDPLNPVNIAQKINLVLGDSSLYELLVNNASEVLKKNYLTPDEKWHAQKALLMKLSHK